MRYGWTWAALCAVGLSGVACGGKTSASDAAGGLAECGEAESCGGDLVGTWDVEAFCLGTLSLASPLATGLPQECSGMLRRATQTLSMTPLDLQLTFDESTYAFTGNADVTATYSYDPSCFVALTGARLDAQACSQVSDTYQSGAVYQGTCTLTAGSCVCDLSWTQALDTTGPYRVDGATLYVNEQPSGTPFCVQDPDATLDIQDASGTVRVRAVRAP